MKRSLNMNKENNMPSFKYCRGCQLLTGSIIGNGAICLRDRAVHPECVHPEIRIANGEDVEVPEGQMVMFQNVVTVRHLSDADYAFKR